MHLIRTFVVCLACFAAALMPVRAHACHMQTQATHMRASAPQAHHRQCPAPMICCAPIAAYLATPAVTLTRAASRRPHALILHDRIGEDAARLRLLRPPTSV